MIYVIRKYLFLIMIKYLLEYIYIKLVVLTVNILHTPKLSYLLSLKFGFHDKT